uniref:MSP domain-containing protein n=1 Tax=Kalanchoe fedtschenkoi TaxID=63787 RepID=A0A7N0VLY5_KALFE
MSQGELLGIEPQELKFNFEVKKQISTTLQLSNKTDHYVAFKKYSVRPNAGIVLPRSTSDIIVTMQAQKEVPVELQSKDKFLLQSVIAPDGSTPKDISPEMFSKEAGNNVEECKLRVVYVVPQRTSPIPEGSDEGSSPKGSASDNGNSNGFAVTRAFTESQEMSNEEKKLAEEVEKALQENRRLRQELEQLRLSASKKTGGISFTVMILVAIFSIILGYLLNR